jgi:hypothetical protein
MKWFAHESNASSDAKIKKLILAYGAEGYAVYFHCLELIASDINENHINFELEHDSEIIADNLKIKGTGTQSGRDRVEEIMLKIISLNLFQEDHGKIFCLQLARRVSSAQIKNEKLKSIQVAVEQRLTESSKNFSENSKEFRLPTIPTNKDYQQDQQTNSGESEQFSPPIKTARREIDPQEVTNFIQAWDDSGCLPPFRKTRLNIPTHEQGPMYDSMSCYTPEEIVQSLENYIKLKSDLSTYKPWTYATPVGFLTKGIGVHISVAKPLEVFASKHGQQQTISEEEHAKRFKELYGENHDQN